MMMIMMITVAVATTTTTAAAAAAADATTTTNHNTSLLTYIVSYICHGVGPLVDPFRSHVSRSLFKDLPQFLLPVWE